MIRYALQCDKGHAFDSWFSDSLGYETQRKRGLVDCPHCGSRTIEKALMAPAIPARKAPEEARQTVALAAGQDRELRDKLRALRAFVEANAEHVGPRFAEEARRIHAGLAEERAIFGEANLGDVQALQEEGIAVAPLPSLPDELN